MLSQFCRRHPRLTRGIATFGLGLIVLAFTAIDHARADDVFLPMVSDLAPVATVSPTPNPSPSPTPGPDDAIGAFFVDTEWKTSSAAIEAGSDGSLHLAYYYYEPSIEGRPTSAVYAYCPGPADQCGDPNSDNWQAVGFLENVREVQLGLTADNRPRLLIKTDSTEQSGGKDYYYVECNADCTNPDSWGGALVITTFGTDIFDIGDDDLPQHSFALDPQGRPRFIYFDRNYPIEPDHYGTYYANCNSECTGSANWSDVLVTEVLEGGFDYDVLLQPSLAFTKAGQPRIVGELIAMEDDEGGIYYFECNANCNQHKNWARVKIFERGQGSELSRDLALDGANRPRVAVYPAFLDGDMGDQLYYLWCNGDCLQAANWESANLALGPENGQGPDIELDAQGRPRIAYIDSTGDALGYTWCISDCETQDGIWAHQTIESADDLYAAWPVAYPFSCDGGTWDGLTPSLDLDPTGNPRVAYDTTYYAQCLYDDDETDDEPPFIAFHLIERAVRVNFFPQPQ